nr:PKD domain-containing protein [Candidatus Sigynarchaeota archaeon]
MVDSISMLGNITLSMAGTPNNTLFMRILQDGHETSYTSLVKNASSAKPGKARSVLGMDFDLSREWEIEIFYGHLNQSTVTNVTGAPGLDDAYSNTTENYIIFGPHGDAHGANPAWLTFNFIDGLSFTLFNVFWAWCNESWIWSINPKDYLITSTLTVKGRVMDRGKDALNVTITYGDEVHTFASNGTTGYVEFSINIHGSDNWGNYWAGIWDAWWDKYDGYWGDWSFDFEDWWDWWWSNNWWLTILAWWIDFLNRFNDEDWFALVFNSSSWNDWYGNWNNDWGDWWNSTWNNVSTICWDDIIIDAVDDDGGVASITASISSLDGAPVLDNLSPQVEIVMSGNPTEEGNVGFTASVVDFYNTSCITNPDSLAYTWDFGDGNVTSGNSTITHSWAHAGDYMVQVSVSDGQYVGVCLDVITIQNMVPAIATISGQNNITEDQVVDFSVYNCIVDTSLDLASMHVIWDFDDGTFATGMNVTHFWVEDGFYNITVHVIDDNCAVGSEILPIAVGEKMPVITGPFGIDVMQGTLASYNLTFEDTILDEQDLLFYWEFGSITSTSPRFLKALPPGLHNGTITISASGNSSMADVSIHVGNIVPTA